MSPTHLGATVAKARMFEHSYMKIPKHEQHDGHRLLSQTELAKALKVHPLTVSRWTTARIIPCHRVGRIVRYDLAAVLAAIAKVENKKGGNK